MTTHSDDICESHKARKHVPLKAAATLPGGFGRATGVADGGSVGGGFASKRGRLRFESMA
jgi:hypothetical protein